MKIPFYGDDILCPKCKGAHVRGAFQVTEAADVHFVDLDFTRHPGNFLNEQIDKGRVRSVEADLTMLFCTECDWDVELTTYEGQIIFVYIGKWEEKDAVPD